MFVPGDKTRNAREHSLDVLKYFTTHILFHLIIITGIFYTETFFIQVIL